MPLDFHLFIKTCFLNIGNLPLDCGFEIILILFFGTNTRLSQYYIYTTNFSSALINCRIEKFLSLQKFSIL